MEKCFLSKRVTVATNFSLGATSLIGVGLIVLMIIAWKADGIIRYPIIFCIGLGFGFFLFLFYGIRGFIVAHREYELSDWGITIQYLGRIKRFYSWDSIRKICICTILRTNDVEGLGRLVIWCTAGKIRREPPDPVRTRWNTEEYLLMYYRSILIMEYTPERLREFKKYSKREIPDYRHV